MNRAATIAQWIRLCLPSCCPGFESQAHHLRFFQFILFKLYICHLNWNVKRTKINKKRPVLAHLQKKEKSSRMKVTSYLKYRPLRVVRSHIFFIFTLRWGKNSVTRYSLFNSSIVGYLQQ